MYTSGEQFLVNLHVLAVIFDGMAKFLCFYELWIMFAPCTYIYFVQFYCICGLGKVQWMNLFCLIGMWSQMDLSIFFAREVLQIRSVFAKF